MWSTFFSIKYIMIIIFTHLVFSFHITNLDDKSLKGQVHFQTKLFALQIESQNLGHGTYRSNNTHCGYLVEIIYLVFLVKKLRNLQKKIFDFFSPSLCAFFVSVSLWKVSKNSKWGLRQTPFLTLLRTTKHENSPGSTIKKHCEIECWNLHRTRRKRVTKAQSHFECCFR